MSTAFGDLPNGSSSAIDLAIVRIAQQRNEIIVVLRALSIVASQDLESDQVAGPRHGQGQATHDLDALCIPHDFVFDAGGRKEQVHDDGHPGPRCGQP